MVKIYVCNGFFDGSDSGSGCESALSLDTIYRFAKTYILQVAITYFFILQQPTFWFCNFLHFYFTTNRYGNVLKFLDRYLSDVKSGHLYDTLDSQNDVQYHMYTVLNILDKNITKQNVADIYENRYDFNDSSIGGLVTMRARVEGLPVEEE